MIHICCRAHETVRAKAKTLLQSDEATAAPDAALRIILRSSDESRFPLYHLHASCEMASGMLRFWGAYIPCNLIALHGRYDVV